MPFLDAFAATGGCRVLGVVLRSAFEGCLGAVTEWEWPSLSIASARVGTCSRIAAEAVLLGVLDRFRARSLMCQR